MRSSSPPDNLKKTLHDTFGISHLRPGQNEVIQRVLQGKDTLAVMPTGSGKSLCYQLPALNMPGTTVVVSPLISLMQDQADKFEEVGVDAAQVNSTLSKQDEENTLQSIRQASSEIVFATPERLSDPAFIADLRRIPIDLFVVDEAHCISKWGHDFRPAYLGLGDAIKALGHPPVLALTATATQDVIGNIIQQLGCDSMETVNTSLYRSNLHYQVLHVASEEEKQEALQTLVRNTEGSGIIYAATLKTVEELYDTLQEAGERVTFYHGRLAKKLRTYHQEQFMHGTHRLMIATNAFGMGIDKPDIRFVIHYQMPGNLDAYYQESGRAGRDGKDAHCILLYHVHDKRVQQFFLARHYPEEHEIRLVYQRLQKLSAAQAAVPFDQLHQEVSELSVRELQVTLKLLQDDGVVDRDAQLCYRLQKTSVKSAELARLGNAYREKNEHDRQALERMVFYAQTGFCRWKVLLAYFGEEVEWAHCDHCDNCLHPPEQTLSPLSSRTQHRIRSRSSSSVLQHPALAPGASVQVPKFGEGKVISVAGDKITIQFPDSRKRTFLRDYVKVLST